MSDSPSLPASRIYPATGNRRESGGSPGPGEGLWSPVPLPRVPGVFGVPRAAPTVGCQALGLAQVGVGGRRAHGADVAAGAVQRDQVGRGPLPGQGTHGAAGCVPVDKGQELPVRAGRADGAGRAAGTEGRVSPSGVMTAPAPLQTTLHRLQHPQKLLPFTISLFKHK